MNQQMLHVTIEIIVFLAIAFWAYSKDRQMALRLKALFQKLDEQENRILALESAIEKMTRDSISKENDASDDDSISKENDASDDDGISEENDASDDEPAMEELQTSRD